MIGNKLYVLWSKPVNSILAYIKRFLNGSYEASMNEYKIFIESFGGQKVFTSK